MRSTCPTRSAARPSRSSTLRATIPTAASCWRSTSQAPQRVEPFCPHFGVCGGCAIQHWAAEPYQAWKRGIVVETLAQAGIDCEVAPLIDAHGAGRRRVTLHGRFGTHDILKVGFAAASSHDVIPIHRCPILDPALDGRDRCRLGARRAADVEDAGDQAARHPGHRDRQRPRCRRARLRSVADGIGHGALARRRAAPPRAADAARRAGAAAPAADIADGPRRGDAAAGLVPASNRRRRRDACVSRRGARRQGQGGRRPLLRRRSLCLAACGEIARRSL